MGPLSTPTGHPAFIAPCKDWSTQTWWSVPGRMHPKGEQRSRPSRRLRRLCGASVRCQHEAVLKHFLMQGVRMLHTGDAGFGSFRHYPDLDDMFLYVCFLAWGFFFILHWRVIGRLCLSRSTKNLSDPLLCLKTNDSDRCKFFVSTRSAYCEG